MGNCVFYGNNLKISLQTHMDNWASKIFVHPTASFLHHVILFLIHHSIVLTLYLTLSSFSSISFNFFAIAAITGTVTLLPACL